MTSASKPHPTRAASREAKPTAQNGIELRAAQRLEEAGEFVSAAVLYDRAGHSDQAAALRLQYSRSISDPNHRLSVLRQSCAVAESGSEEAKALFGALGDAILARIHKIPDPTIQLRGLKIEAACALIEADRGHEAGILYESLGLWSQAASAYEAAGAIPELEYALAFLAGKERRQQARIEQEIAITDAVENGHRKIAVEMLEVYCQEHHREFELNPDDSLESLRSDPADSMLRWKQSLEKNRPKRGGLLLQISSESCPSTALRIHFSQQFRIGRAPDLDLVLAGPSLSREHAAILIDHSSTEGPVVQVCDLGSKSGTFWMGIPLEMGQPFPIQSEGELALGIEQPLHIFSEFWGHECQVWIKAPDSPVHHLLAPERGTLQMNEIELPPGISMTREQDWICIDIPGDLDVKLNHNPVLVPARLDLLLGDHLRIAARGQKPFDIVVHP